MTQAIYGDLYFAVNFTMDALALFLTAKLLHIPASLRRIALGGAVGALYSTVSLLLPDRNLLAAATALLVPCLICILTFGWQNILSFSRQIGAFWLVSMLLGGIMTAVCYGIGVWGEKQVSVGGKVQPLMGDLPFWGLLLLALLVCSLLSLLFKIKKPSAKTVGITVEDASCVALQGLIDSGNLLTEPLSGLPVIVVDRRKASGFLPNELRFLADEKGRPLTATHRLRLIPCKTASGEGILYGMIPKRVLVAGQPRKACIAVTTLPENVDYAAIVPSNLL